MMYLNTRTIANSYKELRDLDIKNASLLHIFLILKGCGCNNLSYISTDKISELGFKCAFPISSLFSLYEKKPLKYDFINPFEMKSWGSQSPSELLEKWAKGRIKNNVLGGATTWRKLIIYDTHSDQFKFTFNYIEEFKKITLNKQKISLPALAIWSQRFVDFNVKASLSDVIKSFIDEYNLSSEEISGFMQTNTNNIFIEYSDEPHSTSEIRGLIGSPDNMSEWQESSPIDENLNNFSNTLTPIFKMPTSLKQIVDSSLIKKVLWDYHQVILSGPPGTSKSFLANKISSEFDKVYNLQFHPQYSYQDFIGGYRVKGDQVEYTEGILLNILKYISTNPSHKVLLIIDEINRANVSQVFGELLQCLDRSYSTQILLGDSLKEINLPNNLFIIATMNSSDRTIGSLDHAVRRRFLNIYCPPNPEVLIDLCSFDGEFSLSDLLKKINRNLLRTLKNRELQIGQSIFLNEKFLEGKLFKWTYSNLEIIFNNRLLPFIEEFCYGDYGKINDILGEELSQRVTGDNFVNAINKYME